MTRAADRGLGLSESSNMSSSTSLFDMVLQRAGAERNELGASNQEDLYGGQSCLERGLVWMGTGQAAQSETDQGSLG